MNEIRYWSTRWIPYGKTSYVHSGQEGPRAIVDDMQIQFDIGWHGIDHRRLRRWMKKPNTRGKTIRTTSAKDKTTKNRINMRWWRRWRTRRKWCKRNTKDNIALGREAEGIEYIEINIATKEEERNQASGHLVLVRWWLRKYCGSSERGHWIRFWASELEERTMALKHASADCCTASNFGDH